MDSVYNISKEKLIQAQLYFSKKKELRLNAW
jgi:hypothetical protein